MSSFEPLFSKAGRARTNPRDVVGFSTAEMWMPMQVGVQVDRVASVFDTELGDTSDVADADASALAEAAAGAARQAELDLEYLRGVSEGREQGEMAERARLRGATLAAESALDDVRAGEARWLVNIEENIAAIAVAVAQQVVTREIATTNDIVLAIVTRAIQEFGLDQALSIRVNPGDLESLQSTERAQTEEMRQVTTGREVRWVSDARIEPGGCVVEGRERIVDGRVDTALERLYRRLTYTNA
jgi:flagellar biosynthesis/type III secretory pathway protein FliH